MTGQIMIQLVLLFLTAVLSLTQAAVLAMSGSRLERLENDSRKSARRLRRLAAEPARLLSSMRAAIVSLGLLSAALASYHFTDRLAPVLRLTGLPERVAVYVSAVIITLVLMLLYIITAELVPKSIAARDPEKTALRLSGTAAAAAVLFAPAAWLARVLSGGILRLLGIDPAAADDTVTEEEIIMMSDAGAENGTIDEDESRIIKNVFAFDDMTAGQICTHRTDVSVLWSGEDIAVWEETIHRTRHSAFPVCSERVDNVIGVLDAKDYFRLDDKSLENIMKEAVREPYFVHENMKADRLFAQMKKKGADHFAVVVDEYGGMCGIVTVTDLVEELVGEFDDDELEETEPEFESISEGVWLIPGITSLDEVTEQLDIRLPDEKSGFDTFGGYVIAELGEIPKDGTQTVLEADGMSIEILDIHSHRIGLCRVTLTAQTAPEGGEEEAVAEKH
ncbi:MAG: HlyC/CorC family transporter [Ruminococcus sp.]|nr:HlyC/CorC family transporter [Ruminococcus sp.]